MKICWNRFNIYLAMLLILSASVGCHTEKGKQKQIVAALRLHQEMRPDPDGHTEQAVIGREHPVKLFVDREPFLTESKVKQAKVIDSMGGFVLSIQFDRQGSWLLEEYTAATRSKHIAIYCQFVEPNEEKINQGRWLGAPRIRARVTDGLLVFTPDATREEAERIALGLNNVAEKLETNKSTNW